MKSFTYKALAVAAAAACGTTAFAGSQVVTQRNFALEAITNTTAVTLPSIVTTIGVGRTTAQDFTVVVKPVSSTTKFNGTCALPTFDAGTGTGTVTVSNKRISASECAYEVDVTAAIAIGDNASLNFSGLVFSNHSLATEGNTESVSVGVFDLGETARIDNSADLTNVVARSWRAVTLIANQDTGTTADVNFNGGNSPLFGFVNQNADTTTVAEANFIVNVNGTTTNASGGAFNAHADLTKVTFTVTGDFDGLQTNFTAGTSTAIIDPATNAIVPTITVGGSGTSSTASFAANGAQLTATGNTTVQVKLGTLATKSLGTSRTFGVSAVVDPSLAGVADQSLAGNSSWWVWGANAIELRSAFFNNDRTNGNLTRFFFQNTGAASVYSAVCHPETGVTVTYGTAKTGTLAAGTTAIWASDICTFSTGQRGSIVFTISSAVGKIKGVYQQAINGVTAGYIPLERPYGNNNTSNGTNF
jgi:hypothetical protein